MIEPSRVKAVVIGASAGGVGALLKIFQGLHGQNFPPVMVVLHFPAQAAPIFEQVFGRPDLQVLEAEDKAPVVSGAIYFAPPGYHLQIEPDKSFSLSVDDAVHFARPSIDVLFETAADVYRDSLLGVLLTGANADGAQGLAYIERLGGQAVVQSLEEADSIAMPQAAISLLSKPTQFKLQAISELFDRLN